jgi:L-amino acid N-acyltransferase YncA
VREIYEEGIRGGDATFETDTPSWGRWDAAHPELRLVAERAGALDELGERSEQAGCWTLTAGVFPENEASVRLHEACGFRQVGVRERLGEAGGVWRDVVLLERRSTLVGT